MAPTETLHDVLARHTRPSDPALVQDLGGGRLRCLACGHRCRLAPGRPGVCRVRFHDGAQLRVPWGYVAGLAADPIEKKPFFHVLPGETALSFGMLGCDLHCAYCQNWITSQALRDEASQAPLHEATPEDLVEAARRHGSRVLVSTYNEPLITADWAAAVFRRAHEAGLACAFVSNGNATPEVLDYLRPVVDFYKVDLKGFDDSRYRRLGGTLSAVLRSLEGLKERGFWVEVVTLVVPDFNDGEDELRSMARFLAALDPDLPWHVTAFHPDYRMDDRGRTQRASLLRAREIGREAGLHHVYAGNLPGLVGDGEDTLCPVCGTTVVRRRGFRVGGVHLENGACPRCATPIPGVWEWPAATG
jgi:pyruvate formate lyase activating enzyme